MRKRRPGVCEPFHMKNVHNAQSLPSSAEGRLPLPDQPLSVRGRLDMMRTDQVF